MPLRVKCSAGHLMMVPDHRAGTVLRCAHCGIDVQVPPAPGGVAKEPTGPRVTAPAIQRAEPRQASGPAARQSPRVAGHSTAPKSGINLPTVGIKKPSLPRTKAPPPVSAESATEPSRAAAAESTVAPPGEAAVPPVEFPLPMDGPQPKPPVSKRPAHETPPLEPEPPPRRREPEPSQPAEAKAPPKPSNRPRMTLTGTMLSPAMESPPEKVVLEKPTLKKPEPARPEPAKPAAKLSETRIDVPREKPAEKSQRVEKPAKKIESERETEAPPVEVAPEPPLPEPAFSPLHAAATIVDPNPPPEPTPPPQFLVLGARPTAAQRMTVWQLAAALLAALLLSIGPSVWEISEYFRSESGLLVARWAFMLLVLGVVQFGCILLLVQVPDWSSVWIVTLMSLGLAAIYAALLGLTSITGNDSPLIHALQLDFEVSRLAKSKLPLWCICLAATYACLAFFAGRISAKWRKALKQAQAAEEAAAAHAY